MSPRDSPPKKRYPGIYSALQKGALLSRDASPTTLGQTGEIITMSSKMTKIAEKNI